VEEEEVVDTKLSVAVRDDDKVCALQKQGSAGMTIKDIETIIDMAIEKSREIRKLITV
jgi:exosome complex RNA-binding protein Rrp42 (RNase PH superfamily)